MGVRQEVNEALELLVALDDPVQIEDFLLDHPDLALTLAMEVHKDEYPPVSHIR